MINLLYGDCLEQMKTLDDNSVDSIVSDPPYGISFMSKKWDYDVPSVEVWKEAMRVLKPGGHALIACGTRTQHRMVCNIEDAGFEIRDVVSWIYGSGFPKSLNISKAIDKAAGAEREVVGFREKSNNTVSSRQHLGETDGKAADGRDMAKAKAYQDLGGFDITAPATDEAQQWDGWGTALKPACEFFTLCRKPLSEKTVAANVLKWGTGGINIDASRVELPEGQTKDKGNPNRVGTKDDSNTPMGRSGARPYDPTQGRFPANLIHDGSQEVLDLFPETKSGKGTGLTNTTARSWSNTSKAGINRIGHNDSGSAARFFYCPKASKKDRNDGCGEFEEKESVVFTNGKAGKCLTHGKSNPSGMNTYSCGCPIQYSKERKAVKPNSNNHPTVKPTALMAYLCRLITPTGGVVLDPYMGSGSTGKAAVREGFSFVGCELDKDYFDIATARVTNGQDLEVRGEDF